MWKPPKRRIPAFHVKRNTRRTESFTGHADLWIREGRIELSDIGITREQLEKSAKF